MRTLLCALAFLIGTTPALAAGETKPAKLTPQEIADGWIMLFDGETTFGWKTENAQVKDGVLTLNGNASANSTSTFGPAAATFRYEQTTADQNKRASVVFAGHRHSLHPTTSKWVTIGVRSDGKIDGFVDETNGKMRFDPTFPPVASGNQPTDITFDVPPGVTLKVVDMKLRPLGLQSIFNGKDLAGWNIIPGHKSKFTVTDKGELNIKDGNGDIQSEAQWADFVLQIDVFSNGPHLNSGVFFRCIPGQFWAGYEAQIRNEWVTDVIPKDGSTLSGSYTAKGDDVELKITKGRTSEVKKLAKSDIKEVIHHRDKPIDYGTGAIYNRQAARKVVSDDYQWFTMTIAAKGNHMAVWVNGYQTADYTDPRPANDNARNGSKTTKGAVSLQGHDPTTDLSFRNIRIAELPSAKP